MYFQDNNKVILGTTEEKIQVFIDDQFGFKRGVEAREAMLTLRQTVEK